MSADFLEEFKRKYPNLFREIRGSKTVRVAAVRTDAREAERAGAGYGPSAIDFLRRCETDEQAVEIIGFLESQGEIDPDYAGRLRAQLARCGLRSFGSKREPGHYWSR